MDSRYLQNETSVLLTACLARIRYTLADVAPVDLPVALWHMQVVSGSG
jgi:hypothetical protein